jgi:hypothetical protein
VTIPLTGTGGHFTRVGKQGKTLNDINTFRGNSGTAGTDWQAIFAQFASTDQIVIDQLWSQLIKAQNNLAGAAAYIQSIAQGTTIQMAQDDQFLEDTSLKAALVELIRQMQVSSDKVKQPAVSVSVTTGNGVLTNHGDGVCIATVLDPLHVQTDYAFAETIVGICSADSQAITSPATLGKEPFTFVGESFPNSALDSSWPIGSSADFAENAITPDDNGNQNTNLLTNGNFETFAGSAPSNWPIAVGATTISKASPGYRGTGALQVAGDGTTLTELSQSFNTSGQTLAELGPLTMYGLNFWIKADSGLAAGVLEIALTDGSGTILQDFAGNNLVLTISLSTLTTSYVAHNVFFRTPAALPSLAKLRIRLTTAATNGKNFYIDDISLTAASQVYPGGPFVAVFSGASKFIVGDQFNVIVANDYSSAWQKMADRIWNMRALGLILPSTGASGSVTIPDSLLS